MLSSNTPPACTLQVSSRGIRVCDFDEKQAPKSSPKTIKKNKGKDKDKDKQKVCLVVFSWGVFASYFNNFVGVQDRKITFKYEGLQS